MWLRIIFPGKWKHYRWEIYPRKYSTHHQASKPLPRNIISTNISINRLVKSGDLDAARKLFDEMPQRTVVSWNTVVSGYSRWGRYEEALRLVSEMHRSDVRFTEMSFSSVLSVCANERSLKDGRQIHALVLRYGCESFDFVGSALLYFYSNCFEVAEAKRVFDELRRRNELLWSLLLVGYVKCNLMGDALDVFMNMPKRDVVAWTTLISGYAKSEDGCEKALEMFLWMRGSGVKPNEFTLDAVIRACGRIGDLWEGRNFHGIVLKYGFQFDHSIGGALIEFYCECKAINDAKRVYERMENPCLNSSNSLLNGLIEMEQFDDVEKIFDELDEVNTVSYNLMIKGYALCGRVEDSKKLFENMPCRTMISMNTMISVYSKNGEIDKALKLFEETKEERNPVTWNSMISAYVQNEKPEEAFRLYLTMHGSSVVRTRSTFSVLFHTCSCLGSLQQGQLFHAHLIKTPFESNVYVGTSLVHMYSKCGSIPDAQKAFMSISSPNVAAWTALINAYAHHGLGDRAVLLFESMLEQGVSPNAATFLGLMSCCCRAGLVDEGLRLFHAMEKLYGVKPTLEHYACLVDLLGRSGRLQEAENLIEQMPVEADEVIWGTLLNACWFWKDMKVGERIAEKMFSMEPKPVSAYVILSNIYAELGKWEEKMNARKRLRCLKAKDPGRSWIEHDRKAHVFSVDDRTHSDCDFIYATLEHLTANLSSSLQFEYDLAKMKYNQYSNAAYSI